MIDPEQIQEVRRALGRRLAHRRREHGLIQEDVARQVHSTRSTVANVENGRQMADRIFWLRCETLLNAGGELITGYDRYQRLELQRRAERDEAARRARWGELGRLTAGSPDLALGGPAGSATSGAGPAAAGPTVAGPAVGTPAGSGAGSGGPVLGAPPGLGGAVSGLPAGPAAEAGAGLVMAVTSLLAEVAQRSTGEGETLTVPAPRGQYLPRTSLDVEVYPAVEEGRNLATIPRPGAHRRWRRSLQRRLVVGHVDAPAHSGIFALDSRQACRRLVGVGEDSRLLIPRVYELDAITGAVLWAVANLDQSLLLDDARLDTSRIAAAQYARLTRSAVSGELAAELDTVSRLWLGSAFCADHIRRHCASLTELPVFWSREQRGEEASTWLFFGHKLRYLRTTADRFATAGQRMTRMFCVPPAAVRASSVSERILLLLAVALIESLGTQTAITDEPEYGTLPGVVLGGRRAIVANWLRADGVWHVDVTDHRPTLTDYRNALGDVRAHSVIAADKPGDRLRNLAEYLALDWRWLRARCAALGEYGLAGIAEPRSRLISLDGVDLACRFVGTQR
ncbi:MULTISPECIES: helix-turn-helix transcriptional regulator [Micromonospora]|uniref:Helix-turn-helix domain-containing protein n=1 Tax=Micromonospora yangpuensis TaxID=683228 RepID=A0A1C6VI97_9ACTN|nr:helix-turn-helix transcriptional regulator [Micromonospora yangpuensis]GGM00250.1 hypothetical protein GCM10012279_17270 [Micromonospora yangpuensis]SCL66049.1 Helix-turn-helix domain-containing protein [Micromonospora yangpuensis]